MLQTPKTNFLVTLISCPLSFRWDLARIGCVHDTLRSDYGILCDELAIKETMARDEVRQGLLDDVDVDYCGKC